MGLKQRWHPTHQFDRSDAGGHPSRLAALTGAVQAGVLSAHAAGLLQPFPQRLAGSVAAHLQGFDVREIMRAYGWTYQKARNLIARGMQDLREALRSRGIHGA